MRKVMSVMLVAMMLAIMVAPIPATAQVSPPGGAGLTVPVTGHAKGGGRITGTFTIHRFVDTGDATNPVGAVGTLVVRTANGRMAVTAVTMPVLLNSGAPAGGQAAIQQQVVIQQVCPILDLTLGPLDVNLLGLVIHLDQVVLTIDADPAGGLLGTLLCAIANLLGPGGTIGNLIQLLTLLNQLLALLGGLFP